MFGRHRPHALPVSRQDVSEARFRRFVRELKAYERKLSADETLNAFLDLYSQWRKTREPMLKVGLVMLAFELNRLDPSFEFDLAFRDDERVADA